MCQMWAELASVNTVFLSALAANMCVWWVGTTSDRGIAHPSSAQTVATCTRL